MSTAHLLLIAAPEWHNKFMIACDLFEQGKVLGVRTEITATYKEGENVTMRRAAKVIKAFEKEAYKGMIVSLAHLIRIEVDGKTTWNDGRYIPYWNKEVRIISTGTHWYMLHKFIAHLGFKVETDEHMYVRSVS